MRFYPTGGKTRKSHFLMSKTMITAGHDRLRVSSIRPFDVLMVGVAEFGNALCAEISHTASLDPKALS